MGKNWNSTTREYENIKSDEIQRLAENAKKLYKKGKSVSEIAKELGKSISRIYEYLK
jgi:transposase|tara:strand:- start:77 stop:247 length:171 start_codon:yes stop_codon:yes gene_type:complete